MDDCKTSFDNPGDLNSRIRLSSPRVAMEMSQYLGFRRGLVERGLDTAQYELNTALVEALDDMPACRARLASGQRAFVKAVVTVSSAGDVV